MQPSFLRLLGLTTAAVFALPLAAQEPGPNPSVAAAWQRFQQDTSGRWLVQWCAPTGTPQMVYGDGLALADWRENSLDEARRQANAQLAAHADLLGLGASDFTETIGARMGRTWTFTFAQRFAGLPVIGGRVDVRIHMSGKLVHLGSTAWPIPADFATLPTIGEAQATALAWTALDRTPDATPQPAAPRAVQLVVWGDASATAPTAPVLAWEVPISAVDASGNGPIGRVYVDARTGAFLQFASDKHECGIPGCRGDREPPAPFAPIATTVTVMAWTHTLFSPVSTPTNVALPGVKVTVPGQGTFTTDLNGQFTVDLQAPTQITVALKGTHCSTIQGTAPMTATLTLQPGVNAVAQLGTAGAGEQPLAHSTTYYWTWQVNEWARAVLGNSFELSVADTVSPFVNITSTCNAYYTTNTINFYQSGGGCNNTAAASVVAHEWGHGLDDRYGGISQTNGLSEGWGDICSMYLLDDPQIGHDFFAGGGGIRNGNNNRQYPTGSGPHAQGESWMGFAWLFRQNLRTTFGTSLARSISDDVLLGSIAANAVDQPGAVVAAFQADDDDGLLGNGTPHWTALVAACNAHSLPYPQLIDGYLEHTPLTTTFAQGVPRRVELTAVPINGSFTQARVLWNDGQSHTRGMVPSGAANGWHALLPGMLGGQTLQYHLEAQHSNGTWFRMPVSGEYSYGTLAERRIWREDFEAGGAGWTHHATGTDDWQIGAPAGHGGFGWSDPAAAVSGAACAGTDLDGDGAYATPTDSWLVSPPIDCTGESGVRLRFKRWVSCAGPTDRLEVWIAGMLTWSSSFSLLSDSAWSTIDLPATAATNNPAVVVEFRLVSAGSFPYGGWNLDDVELYTMNSPPPLSERLQLLPEQAQQGTTVTLSLTTQGPQPFVLALGDQPGPLSVPGFPTLSVGGALTILFGATDAAGHYATSFAAPAAPAIGSLWYGHALTLSGSGALVTTNPTIILFTP